MCVGGVYFGSCYKRDSVSQWGSKIVYIAYIDFHLYRFKNHLENKPLHTCVRKSSFQISLTKEGRITLNHSMA